MALDFGAEELTSLKIVDEALDERVPETSCGEHAWNGFDQLVALERKWVYFSVQKTDIAAFVAEAGSALPIHRAALAGGWGSVLCSRFAVGPRGSILFRWLSFLVCVLRACVHRTFSAFSFSRVYQVVFIVKRTWKIWALSSVFLAIIRRHRLRLIAASGIYTMT